MKNFYFTESKSHGAGNSSGQLFVRETNKKSRHFWLQLILCLLAFFVVGRVSAKQDRTFTVTMNNTTINPTKPYIEFKYVYRFKGSGGTSGDDYRTDCIRGTQIYLKVGNDYHAVVWVAYKADNMQIENNGDWGVAQMTAIDDPGSNYLRYVTMRLYPSAKAIRGGLSGFKFEGANDHGEDGKTSSVKITRQDNTSEVITSGDELVSSECVITVEHCTMPNCTFDRPGVGQVKAYFGDAPTMSYTNADNVTTNYTSYGYEYFGANKVEGLGTLNSADGKSMVIRNGASNKDDNQIVYSGYLRGNLTIKNGSNNLASSTPSENSVTVDFLSDDKNATVKGCAYPESLQFTPDMWSKSVVLDWTGVDSNNRIKDGKWYVYRRMAGSGDFSLIGTTTNFTTCTFQDNTTSLDYEKKYDYKVCFARDAWNISKCVDDLSTSDTTSIIRSYSVSNVEAVGDSNSIKVSWKYPVYVSKTNPTFDISRKSSTEASFSKLGTVTGVAGSADSSFYVDKSVVGGGCVSYTYQVEVIAAEKKFTFTFNESQLLGASQVRRVICSKGTYANIVKITWNSKQIGADATKYILKRRLLGSTNEDDFASIYTTQGTAEAYVYDDNTASPGSYYEYKVESYIKCSDSYSRDATVSDNGFCQSSGIVSGRITYGSGVAVPNAKVILTTSATDNVGLQFYSMEIKGYGDGITCPLDSATANKIFGKGKPFSMEMWCRPNFGIQKYNSTALSSPKIFIVDSLLSVILKPDATGANYKIGVRTADGTESVSKLSVAANLFSHLTFSTDGAGKWKIRVVSGDSVLADSATISTMVSKGNMRKISFGSVDKDSTYTFKGFLDEIRVWSKDLSDKEILKYYDHPLAGSENGLQLYWPLDENITNQLYAYDYSKVGNVSNGNHGKIQGNTVPSKVTPTKDQLSLYGLTDEYGNYVIRGIPFRGEGTNYIVAPLLGVHEFNPQQSTRFVSSSSLNFSSVDFSDVSSFPVTGVVYYKDTNYPVEGANFYVDGTICSKNGEPCVTDKNGAYNISVPIGKHYITIKKNGHVFEGNGRYPTDPKNLGNLVTFDKAMENLTFYDSTLVCVAGRVVGGDIEKEKALGLGLSKNNIGQAVLKLVPNAGTYRMNILTEIKGTVLMYKDNPKNLEVKSPTTDVNSISYRRGGNAEFSRGIYITTDAQTGEFAAMLPPIVYKLDSLSMVSANGAKVYLSDNFVKSKDIIDASNPLSVNKDSVSLSKGNYKTFEYCVSELATYYNEPSFTVQDSLCTKAGFFGEVNVTEADKTKIPVIDNGKYVFGYPIFVKDKSYVFILKGFEEYQNYDSGAGIKTIVPLSNVNVKITNQMSSEQSVYISSGVDENGTTITAGDFAPLKSNTLTLDSTGCAIYEWTAGFPSVQSPYTSSLTMVYEHNNRNYDWTENGNLGITGIVLGTQPSGNDFVTDGPSQIDMVLRDPPGSNSYAYWDTGTTSTVTRSYGATGTIHNKMTFAAELGTEIKTSMGTITVASINTAKTKYTNTTGTEITTSIKDNYSTTKTSTLTQRISTSGAVGYVGADGDVFVGNSTNLVFGDARKVYIKKDTEGNYSIDLKNVITESCRFKTEFVYSQTEIENDVIPNLYKLRNNLLQTVSQSDYDGLVNNTDSLMYVTLLKPTDKNYGTTNCDTTIWSKSAVDADSLEGPSYKIIRPSNIPKGKKYYDKVKYYDDQIASWQKTLYDNEKAKVDAITANAGKDPKNYSFDAGTSVDNSISYTSSSNNVVSESRDVLLILGIETGALYNTTGVLAHFETNTSVQADFSQGSSSSSTRTTGFHLQSTGSEDALTVDVYEPEEDDKTNGPIFYTRAGRTSCPYEGEEKTKYYEPGKHNLAEATMKVEIPKISAKNGQNVVHDVAAGSKAAFNLVLNNISETSTGRYFNLVVLDKTNQQGAVLSLPTGALGNGHTVFVPANDTVNVKLYLTQGSQDILDYNDIGLALTSTCDASVADTVYLSAHFVPSSSDITMKIEKRVINSNTGSKLTLNLRDYDATYKNLKDIIIQYRGEHDVNWTTAKRYMIHAADTVGGYDLLPSGGMINAVVDMSNSVDQTYIFRAVTECTYGAGFVTKNSEEITVIKDMSKPQLLGFANPSNGILSAGDEISATFNEAIKGASLNKATDFLITGVLNGAKVAHDVALKMENTDVASAATTSDILLSGKNFSADMWVNIHGAGTIFSHGYGTNKFIVGSDETGHLVVHVGNESITSTSTLPQNQWEFLTFNYTRDTSNGLLSAMVAYGDESVNLFNTASVPLYTGVGNISVGKNMSGAIQELALWDRARSVTEAQAEMNVTKTPSTPNLIGYWKFDEGNGLTATDYSRNHHMTLKAANWYLNNVNKAVALNGSQYLALDISAHSALTTDDYAFEMWFKGDKQEGNSTLFSTTGKVGIGFDAAGLLQMTSAGKTTAISTKSYLDNSWHHIALNVLRNGNAITYVDGVAVNQVSASSVEPMQGNAIYLGAERYLDDTGTYSFRNFFKGGIDEVRFWKATLSASVIRAARMSHLHGTEPGLVAYYPFETKTLDHGQVVVVNSDMDVIDSVHCTSNEAITYSDEAPSLKEAATETNVGFGYVTSDNKVVISLTEEAAAIENCTVNFCLQNVRDANDNLSQAINWSAYVRQNRLLWDENATSLKQESGNTSSFTAKINNGGSSTENWSLSNLPSWLTASATEGSLNALESATITFNVSNAVPIGKYEETIYLCGKNKVYEPFVVSLQVTGKEPSWTVNPADFESNMNMIGQVQFAGIPSEDADAKIAAFIDGECRGVAQPVYYPRYDSYYTIMDIYGKSSDAGKTVTFKAWDASTGTVYPSVLTDTITMFSNNKLVGSIKNPFIWNAENVVEQDLALAKGWNWISFNTFRADMGVNRIFGNMKSSMKIVKGQCSFAVPTALSWAGKLSQVAVGNMYMLQATSPVTLSTTGTAADVTASPVAVNKGWNWIGCNTSYNMSVADAFAGVNPVDGDLIKGQTGFAIYEDFEWVGTLKNILPGHGYMYQSKSSDSRSFCYPLNKYSSLSKGYGKELSAENAAERTVNDAVTFTPVSVFTYPNNMTVVGCIVDGNSPVANAEVGVFVDDECRSAEVSDASGMVYLTISGEGSGMPITFKVNNGGSVKELSQGLLYSDNATYGTPDEPYLIQLSPTAINGVSASTSIRVYPTRVVSDVNVDAGISLKRIMLEDTGGRILMSQTTGLSEHNVISMSGYAYGMYVVVVEAVNGTKLVKRILK